MSCHVALFTFREPNIHFMYKFKMKLNEDGMMERANVPFVTSEKLKISGFWDPLCSLPLPVCVFWPRVVSSSVPRLHSHVFVHDVCNRFAHAYASFIQLLLPRYLQTVCHNLIMSAFTFSFSWRSKKYVITRRASFLWHLDHAGEYIFNLRLLYVNFS